jgi:hypothetical protein
MVFVESQMLLAVIKKCCFLMTASTRIGNDFK